MCALHIFKFERISKGRRLPPSNRRTIFKLGLTASLIFSARDLWLLTQPTIVQRAIVLYQLKEAKTIHWNIVF